MLLLLHVPPDVALFNVVFKPMQTAAVPVIEAGSAFTVIPFTAKHPVDNVYVIVALPAATPETLPDVPTEATEELLLLHVPPEVALVNAVAEPTQTEVAPLTAAGFALTVTVATS